MTVDVFEAERGRLVGIAYRMLGDVAASEDIVQEAYLRWSTADRGDVERPAAYLTTIVTRLSLDRLRSAAARRETYVGPWLAEPVFVDPSRGTGATTRSAADPTGDPEAMVGLAESVTIGFLHLLDQLQPLERAVFLLHDVFDYRFSEIGAMVDRSEAATRQIAARARRRLDAHREPHRRRAADDEEQALVDAFAIALAEADLERVRALLVDDAVTTSDGGGRRHAALRPVMGADRVARFLVGIAKKAPPDVRVDRAIVNSEPAFVVWFGSSLEVVITLGVTPQGIDHLHAVRNPEKLGAIAEGYELPW